MFIVGLTACGSKVEQVGNNSTQETGEQIQETNKLNENIGDTNNKDLKDIFTVTYEIPTYDIFIDVPSNYMPISNGYTQLFNVGGQKSIGVTGLRRYDPTSLQDAHEKVFEEYVMGFENHARIDSLSVEKEETIDINGREVYMFEGQLNCTDQTGEYKIYAVGYSFIMDEIPCMVIGTVLEKEQPQDMIDEIRTYVDYMITTLRSEK